MASKSLIFTLIMVFPLLISQTEGDFIKKINRKLLEKENLNYMHFYMHGVSAGTHPTTLTIVTPTKDTMVAGAGSTNTIDGVFGTINMINNALTEGPESSSKLVGRAQGLYGQASQEGTSLLMVMHFVFLEGKYNGSSIAVLGNNEVYNEVREMPVVGGSGVFRLARGYVEASTYAVNETANGAIVDFKVYVLHY